MAAVLACGDGAMLSHRSAAALWEIGTERRGVIDVSVTPAVRTEASRVCAFAAARLSRRQDVASVDGIPVTDPVQTLVDLATELAPIASSSARSTRRTSGT